MEMITQAQEFARIELLNRGNEINDEWIDYNNLDLHFYFNEVGEHKTDNGVFAYPVKTDEDGWRVTDTSRGTKIIDWNLDTIKVDF